MNALALLAVAATTIVVGVKPPEDITIYASKDAAETCKTEKCALLTKAAVEAVYKAGVEEGRRQFLLRMNSNMCLRGAT
jgi:hypothetical protein